MIFVADSSVWINHFRDIRSPQVERLRSLSSDDRLVVGDLIVLEVLRGVDSEREATLLRRGFEEVGIEGMLDSDLAFRAASYYRQLRSRGITVSKTVDLIIATFCITRGYALLHQDKDFGPFEIHLGLQVVR